MRRLRVESTQVGDDSKCAPDIPPSIYRKRKTPTPSPSYEQTKIFKDLEKKKNTNSSKKTRVIFLSDTPTAC